jgi:transposase-like protein
VPYLSSSTRAALERVLAADQDHRTEPLQRLRDIRTLLTALDEDPATLRSVRDALDAGAGWDEIAAAAGLKPAAAKWRWQGSDADIAERHEAGRKRSARPSSIPTDLPGLSVADAATRLGVSAQAIYLRVSRGTLRAETIELPDGRSYKRVFPDEE